MNRKAFVHSVILVVAVGVAFLWVSDETLSYYSLQVSGVLLLTLLITHRILRPSTFHLVESTVSTVAVLLVTAATGGVPSPLFFLNYLLLFELSLLLEPIIPVVLATALMFFYFYSADGSRSPVSLKLLIELISFPLMTPLAYFLGNIYRKVQNQKLEINRLEEKVEELTEELVNDEIK